MIYLPKDIVEILQSGLLDIYLRRSSSDNEDKQMRSIPGQLDDVTSQLVDRYNLKIGKIFRESQSAHKTGRPYFRELLDRSEKGITIGHIMWHPNRGARNSKDGGEYVYLIGEGKIKILLTCHGFFVNTARDKEYLTNEFTRATRDSDDKSEAVKRGYRDKIRRGYIPSGRLPDGYVHKKVKATDEMVNIPDKNRFYKQKEAIHKIIYEGFTPLEALDYLNNDLEYTVRKTRRMGGGPMKKSTWYRRLSDPILIGDLSRWKQNHHHEDTSYEASFDEMITEDEFETLQIKLGNKGTRRKKKKNWPYNGQMTCGTCGSAVLMEEHWQIRCPECKKKFALAEGRTECFYCKFPIEKMNTQPLHYIHVRCGKTKKLTDGSRCPERSVPLKDFEENINDILVGLEIPESFTNWAIKWIKILHKEDTNEHEKDLKRVNRMYSESDTQLRNLILMRANREIDEKEFKEMRIAAKNEKKKWEEKRHALEQHTDKWIDELEKIFNFATHARYWFAKGDMDTKRTILSAIGSNLKLKDRKLRIEGLNPFLVLQDMKKTKDYKSVLFELSEKPEVTAQNTTSISAFPNLLASIDAIRTYFTKTKQPIFIPAFA